MAFKEDLKRYGIKRRNLIKAGFTGHTIIAVMNYRIANWLYRHHIKFFPEFIMARTLRRYCCEISPYANISAGLFIPHTAGIIIGHSVVMGKNCEIFQHVTIGSNRKFKGKQCMPIIGDNVSIGSGATVVGPICIGDNVVIGANAYIDKDIPANTKVIPTQTLRNLPL